jgi:hypothetical protein
MSNALRFLANFGFTANRFYRTCISWRAGVVAAGVASWLLLPSLVGAASFDAAPFGLPLPEGNGVMWEDPREIHRVIVHFGAAAPEPGRLRLEYWGSWWPERHLPKDHEPGGGDVGWMELGNWYQHGWRRADAEVKTESNRASFTFRPVNLTEYPKLKEYPAPFRYTLKIRVVSEDTLPSIWSLEALTDSTTESRQVRLAWNRSDRETPELTAFNGAVEGIERVSPGIYKARLRVAANSDPNTFDRTLITVRSGADLFTFKVDDLNAGPLFLPHLGVAVLPNSDERDYSAVAAEQKSRGARSLYDRVAEMPEQTWRSAWEGVPRKKSRIYFPLGLDGGRQRFQLNADGSIQFRSNDHFLKARPGADTSRLDWEPAPARFEFDLPAKPAFRTLQEESLPVCETVWDLGGVGLEETTVATELGGTQPGRETPPADVFAVLLARLTFTNKTDALQTVTLPMRFKAGGQVVPLQVDGQGFVWSGRRVRGQVITDRSPVSDADALRWWWMLSPHQTRTLVLKIPYILLTANEEREALAHLNFDRERTAVASYWRRQLDRGAQLITPEPMLNEFYRSDAMHLLVNCEREPGSDRRFARVGSFSYGAYGNESCMMVVDLDRRGYHREAQECLDAWLHYQSTVGLPGSFASKEGILYGAGGYEAGGYNQHHGWILWMLAEHYRFTRDEEWLKRSAAGLVKACDWIISETKRTADRPELERGLLPAGSLEDIGDWWTWLSTSCYTWRGLDSAAWALEQIQHSDAPRLRREADAFHQALLANFHAAAARSPVVRLRDGTAVPHIPSHVHRRGRCFGWICETLEGALHLLITRAIDPNSQEATWIVKDYEDNLFLSNQYGYTLDDFDRHWFGRGGMSMQACLLLDVDAYLYRDDVKHALRSLFNGEAVSYFPDVRMNTEHALPDLDDWRGDQFKSSDESNTCGWLRSLFVREEGDRLLLGQGVPREWLKAGQRCGIERTATYFGPASVVYSGGDSEVTALVDGPRRNPPAEIRLRFRHPQEKKIKSVTINGQSHDQFSGEWVTLPGSIGTATVKARFE